MQRARRRWKAVSVLVAASLAALVVAFDLGASRASTDPEPQTHLFPAAYYGPVWLALPLSDTVIDVRIAWGEWTHAWTVQPGDPRTYRFTKDKPRPDDENIPVVVTVDPDVDVEFGHGTFPQGAQPLPAEWDPLASPAGQ